MASTKTGTEKSLTLRQAQSVLAQRAGQLILYMVESGYEVTLGDAYRDPRVFGAIGTSRAYGHPRSNHKRRLAIDLNLFLNGEYMDETDDHRQFGLYWEELGKANGEPLRWGGHYNDGNHYELVYRRG